MNKVVHLRKYDAASQSTRTSNWLTQSSDANVAINRPDIIRNRARDLIRNNPWAAKGVSVIVNNVIGHGIRPQFMSPRRADVRRAEQLWKAWADTTQCDVNGLTNFYGLQQVAMRAVVESGECIIRFRARQARDNLAVPFQLQVLEPDYLYEYNDGKLDNGGYVNRGIEYDAIGRRVAYYLYKAHPGASLGRGFSFNNEYSRVPADEVIHLFRIDRPGQERGVSWLSAVIIRLRELDIFEDAYLNRQKLANLFAAFVSTDNPEDTEEEFTDMSELLSGAMYLMKHGRSVDFSNPPKADDYGPYTLANLKAVAAGLGITYESLTGDLSEVNFSSARMGWQEFGRSIDSWRWQLFIPRFCTRVTDWFSLLAGLDGLSSDWTPPARMMVDPARELKPVVESVRAGLTSLPEALRERGYNPEQVLREIAANNALLDQLGLVLDTDPRNTTQGGQQQPQVNDDNTD